MPFIKISIIEVMKTLLEAIVLCSRLSCSSELPGRAIIPSLAVPWSCSALFDVISVWFQHQYAQAMFGAWCSHRPAVDDTIDGGRKAWPAS